MGYTSISGRRAWPGRLLLALCALVPVLTGQLAPASAQIETLARRKRKPRRTAPAPQQPPATYVGIPYGAGSVPLTVTAAGNGAPSTPIVFTGIPFPPARITSPDQVALVNAAGQSVGRFAETLSTYADGSLRVVLLGFEADLAAVAAGGASYQIVFDGTRAPAPSALGRAHWTRNVNLLAKCPPEWYGDSGVFNLQMLASRQNSLFPAFDVRMRERYQKFSTTLSDTSANPDYRNFYDHLHALYMALLRSDATDPTGFAPTSDGTSDAENLRKLLATAQTAIADEVTKYRAEILPSGPYAGQYHAGSRITHASPMLLDTIRRQYPQGLLEDYYFTGDEESRRVALLVADALLADAYLDVERFTAMERQPGFAIMGLCAAYEATLDRRYLDGARHVANAMMDHQEAMAAKFGRRLGAFVQDYNGRWYDPEESTVSGAGSPWMTGLLCEGLIRLYWLTGEERVRQSVVAAADWVATTGFAPKSHRKNRSGHNGFWYIAVDPNDATVYPALNPMSFQMLGWAYQATSDSRLAEKLFNVAHLALGANVWAQSMKEFNQGLHSSVQGLYLLQQPRGLVPLSLAQAGGAAPAPTAPTFVTAAGGATTIRLGWNAQPGATGYRVYRRAAGDAEWTLLSGIATGQSGGTITAEDASPAAGVEYLYAVSTETAGGEGGRSEPVTATAGAAGGGVTVQGRVTASGRGLAGVVVTDGVRSTTTDASGSYALAGVVEGASVRASKRGYTFSRPVSVSAAAPAASFASGAAWIFREALPNGWAVATSRARVSLAATSPIAEEARSMALTVSDYAEFAQAGGPGISLAGKTALRFFLNGGSYSGQRLWVEAIVDGVLQGRRVPVVYAPGATGWVEYEIGIDELTGSRGSLTGLRFGADSSQKQVFVDVLRVD